MIVLLPASDGDTAEPRAREATAVKSALLSKVSDLQSLNVMPCAADDSATIL